MKLIWKSDDSRSCVIKFTKKEFIIVITLLIDDYFISNFEAHDVSKEKSIDYLIIQKNDISIDDCISYLKLRFADDKIKK